MSIDIWKSLAGIAIFLLGMNFLEEGLTRLAGRSFKLFLKKQTANYIKAIIGGAIVTGLLQSSSIVNLMVLAFVGAGVIKMKNALALILGANLGSTLTSWIIVSFGFSFNLENLALPVTAISGIIFVLAAKDSKLHHWCRMLVGFGFLFIGLGYIKTGVENSVQQFNLEMLHNQPTIIFLLAGFLITAAIQSSAATMAITLSALHVNAISLFSAMAIILGSEAGTAIKLILASINGTTSKKQLATGNLLFNVIGTIIAFLLLQPLNLLIVKGFAVNDNLVALVIFQTMVNLGGIILFYPFLNVIGKWLEKRFSRRETEGLYLPGITGADSQLAAEALEKETVNFIYHVLTFASSAFEADHATPTDIRHKKFEKKSLHEKYEYIKVLHGEIQRFAITQSNFPDLSTRDERTSFLLSAVRNGMYAAKNIRDALHDIQQLQNSSNDIKYGFYKKNKEKMIVFCRQIEEIIDEKQKTKNFEQVSTLYRHIQSGYTQSLQDLYDEAMVKHVSQSELSTLINFNREMYTAYKSLIFSIKDYVLDQKEADKFDEMPGFIR